eukprot:2383005-Rhodomonas_salina.2
MSGTEVRYAATRQYKWWYYWLRESGRMPGTTLHYQPTRSLRDVSVLVCSSLRMLCTGLCGF